MDRRAFLSAIKNTDYGVFYRIVLLLAAVSAFALMGCAGSEAIRTAPSIDAATGLSDKLLWIKHNASSGSTYIIELHSDERIGMLRGNISLKDKTVSDVTIILRGVGENRTIYPTATGNFVFSIGRGVTLILDENITVKGLVWDMAAHYAMSTLRPLIHINSAGTLVMLDGSIVSNNINNSGNGGAINVHSGGVFHMNGGDIYGVTCYPGPRSVQASLMGQQIGRDMAATTVKKMNNLAGVKLTDPDAVNQQELKIPVFNGGGVYVSKGGTFIKTGGTITGHADDPAKSNKVYDHEGRVAHGRGHAAYIGDHAIDNTIGPDVYIRFHNGELTQGLASEHPEIQPFKLPPATPAPPKDTGPEQVAPEIVAQDTPETTPVQTPTIPTQQTQEISAAKTLSLQPSGNTVTFNAEAAKKSNIAVYVTGAKDPDVNRALGMGVQYALVRTGQYDAAARNEAFLASIAEEERSGARGAGLDSSVSFHAKRLGVEFVCLINMVHALESYYISARLIDAWTGENKARGSSDNPLKTIADIRGASVDLVRDLLDLSVSARQPSAAVLRSRIHENMINNDQRQFTREPLPHPQTIRQQSTPAVSDAP